MALSNKFGRLVLSTGNKSEMAVGYATLYGDMCGGYAPLKDVYKTLVWDLARWRNAREEDGNLPFETQNARRQIRKTGNGLGDSARSHRTSAFGRAARRTRPIRTRCRRIRVLDAMLERFVDGEESQAEIVAAGFDEAAVRRIARLVLGSEYKRRQSAPGPKITTRAFGRNRRYPISSGWR